MLSQDHSDARPCEKALLLLGLSCLNTVALGHCERVRKHFPLSPFVKHLCCLNSATFTIGFSILNCIRSTRGLPSQVYTCWAGLIDNEDLWPSCPCRFSFCVSFVTVGLWPRPRKLIFRLIAKLGKKHFTSSNESIELRAYKVNIRQYSFAPNRSF